MAVATLTTHDAAPSLGRVPAPVSGARPDDEAFVGAAATVVGSFGPDLVAALDAFRTDPGPSGALLLRGVPTGSVPATPATPTSPTPKDLRSEQILLAVARTLGEPVGYLPEHGGSIVQNLVPTEADVGRQTSTSSGVDLAFHTETAFHPFGPRYLLLLCLRGDPAAATTLASVDDLLPHLLPDTVEALRRPVFRTAVDESFGGRSGVPYGPARAVLGGLGEPPWLCWDEELTTGETPEATAALGELRTVVAQRRREVVLVDGDLLIVDNRRCVHGRRPFHARFDGTDRWLQRAFVVDSLGPSTGDRVGRIITTSFATAA
ncbi:TauD/TfdA family dioxygenase [Aquihabitans daechungensis]|uniref:TauD/TfdA family dioxygenase n=1 Tax=Aquihabitans daechungensis TaxID=1052257 RepID=UPI003BA199B6